MKNPNGQIYCVKCETWIIEKETSAKKQRFGEIVTMESILSGQRLQLKEQNRISGLSKIYSKFVFTFDKHILTSLQMKLVYLTNLLNNESDAFRIEKYLDLIRSCIQNIKEARDILKVESQ